MFVRAVKNNKGKKNTYFCLNWFKSQGQNVDSPC